MAAATAPVKPVKLEPDHVYLQVSYASAQPPSLHHDSLDARYVGPIGELKGEGIYQVVQKDGAPVKRSESWHSAEKGLVDQVRRSDGVKAVKVMPELKQRQKRDEF
ncbi:hypothetical protein IAU60_004679 [Kwoniella sp. DSM 27419]